MEENKFYNKDGKEIKRMKCEVYTRVMWYLRPVSHYNTGKKSEFYSRTCFCESKALNNEYLRKRENARFIDCYSCIKKDCNNCEQNQ